MPELTFSSTDDFYFYKPNTTFIRPTILYTINSTHINYFDLPNLEEESGRGEGGRQREGEREGGGLEGRGERGVGGREGRGGKDEAREGGMRKGEGKRGKGGWEGRGEKVGGREGGRGKEEAREGGRGKGGRGWVEGDPLTSLPFTKLPSPDAKHTHRHIICGSTHITTWSTPTKRLGHNIYCIQVLHPYSSHTLREQGTTSHFALNETLLATMTSTETLATTIFRATPERVTTRINLHRISTPQTVITSREIPFIVEDATMSRFNLILLSQSALHILSLSTLETIHTITPNLQHIWPIHLSKNDRYLILKSSTPSPEDKTRKIPTVHELDIMKRTETVWPRVKDAPGYFMRTVEYRVDGEGRRTVGCGEEVLFYRGLPKETETEVPK
ncbi:hypothetical protein HDV00_005491 [Rhizophlyctis rosea]|nr:hypothetical protein HDV00_005491 [Rhizophlyctis rosea]